MPSQNACQAILELLDIMKTLRSPDGCPWDALQTPESLAAYIVEEAAELVEAIESHETDAVRDEAGDLLLQVVFLSQIYSEQGLFNFADVAAGISRKLIRRHPHVFEKTHPGLDASELDRQWDSIKRQEKKTAEREVHPLEDIPVKLPALQRAGKVLARADKAGLQLDAGPIPAISGTLTEKDLGRELFALVSRAHAAGLDAERALRGYLRTMIDQAGFPGPEKP